MERKKPNMSQYAIGPIILFQPFLLSLQFLFMRENKAKVVIQGELISTCKQLMNFKDEITWCNNPETELRVGEVFQEIANGREYTIKEMIDDPKANDWLGLHLINPIVIGLVNAPNRIILANEIRFYSRRKKIYLRVKQSSQVDSKPAVVQSEQQGENIYGILDIDSFQSKKLAPIDIDRLNIRLLARLLLQFIQRQINFKPQQQNNDLNKYLVWAQGQITKILKTEQFKEKVQRFKNGVKLNVLKFLTDIYVGKQKYGWSQVINMVCPKNKSQSNTSLQIKLNDIALLAQQQLSPFHKKKLKEMGFLGPKQQIVFFLKFFFSCFEQSEMVDFLDNRFNNLQDLILNPLNLDDESTLIRKKTVLQTILNRTVTINTEEDRVLLQKFIYLRNESSLFRVDPFQLPLPTLDSDNFSIFREQQLSLPYVKKYLKDPFRQAWHQQNKLKDNIVHKLMVLLMGSSNHQIYTLQTILLRLRKNNMCDISWRRQSIIGMNFLMNQGVIGWHQFRQIFGIVDSKILQRKVDGRLNLQLKFRAIAIHILFLFVDDFESLVSNQIEQYRNDIRRAIQQTPKIFRSLLNQPSIQKIFKNTHQGYLVFLTKVLIQEEEIKWSEAIEMLIETNHGNSEQSQFHHRSVKQIANFFKRLREQRQIKVYRQLGLQEETESQPFLIMYLSRSDLDYAVKLLKRKNPNRFIYFILEHQHFITKNNLIPELEMMKAYQSYN